MYSLSFQECVFTLINAQHCSHFFLLSSVAIDYLTVTFQHIDSLVNLSRFHILIFQILFQLAPLIQTQMNANNALLKTVDLPSSKFSDVAAATFQIYIKVKQFFQFESDFPPEYVSIPTTNCFSTYSFKGFLEEFDYLKCTHGLDHLSIAGLNWRTKKRKKELTELWN